MTKRIGRNDPCPCGSGKKYKKCCESRLGRRKFQASPLSSHPVKASQISSAFFKKNISYKSASEQDSSQ